MEATGHELVVPGEGGAPEDSRFSAGPRTLLPEGGQSTLFLEQKKIFKSTQEEPALTSRAKKIGKYSTTFKQKTESCFLPPALYWECTGESPGTQPLQKPSSGSTLGN